MRSEMATTPDLRVRRVFDKADDQDGVRVLVDRVWPRGISVAKAALHEWCKDVAPSTELREWYSHDPAKFEEFTRRYGAAATNVTRPDPHGECLRSVRDRRAGSSNSRDPRAGRPTSPSSRDQSVGDRSYL
jgi:uncharacterized protein YeaO (DUF488 family)